MVADLRIAHIHGQVVQKSDAPSRSLGHRGKLSRVGSTRPIIDGDAYYATKTAHTQTALADHR
jgi:hypothetical protein